MAAMDHLIGQMRRNQEPQTPPDCVARFMCTKHSWRGKYRRIFCITPRALVTQHPDTLTITNTWSFVGEPDIDAVGVGASDLEDQDFTMSVRQDAKSKYKTTRFSCKQRAALLTVMYQCMAHAADSGQCGIAMKMLGSPSTFAAYKLRKGRWVECRLRITAFAMERLDASGDVRWRLDVRQAASPAARLLAPAPGDPALAFALFGRVGRSPRVYASSERDSLLKALQAAALKRLGITLAVDTQAGVTGAELLRAVAAAERERAAAPGEAPLGQWAAVRIRSHAAAPLTTQALLASSEEAQAALQEGGEGRRRGVARRLVLTAGAFLERRPATYEVAERRQLAALAALVCFAGEPTWLALEWTDGAPAAMYITPHRDALAAALLDAAQVSAGRPIPVLAQHTFPGNVILASRATSGLAPPSLHDPELEKMCLAHLAAAAKEALAALPDAPPDERRAAGSGGGGGDSTANASDASSDQFSVGSPEAAPRRRGGGGLLAQRERGGGARGASLRLAAPAGQAASQEAVQELLQRVAEANACLPYAGIAPPARPDEAVLVALLSLLPPPPPPDANLPPPQAREAGRTIALLQCLQRLATAGAAASSIVATPGSLARVFAALACGHDGVAGEAARLLTRLWAPAAARTGQPPWALPRPLGGGEAADPHTLNSLEDSIAARAAKTACLAPPGRAAALLGVLGGRSGGGAGGPLATMAAGEALVAVVVEPGARSTDPILRHALLAEAGALGRPLFALFSHPAARVLDAAALVMRAVAEGGASAAAPMREAALAEGALLTHLLAALSAQGARAQLSRDLVALWADEYGPALGVLRAALPTGLMRYLNQPRPRAPSPPQPPPRAAPGPDAPPAGPEHVMSPPPQRGQAPARSSAASPLSPVASPPLSPRSAEAAARRRTLSPKSSLDAPGGLPPAEALSNGDRGTVPVSPSAGGSGSGAVAGANGQLGGRKSEDRGAGAAAGPPQRGLKGNWDALWAAVARDHCHAGLIWNETTRAELHEALQAEAAVLAAGRARGAGGAGREAAWNHGEFAVAYPSLGAHLCLGGVYVRLLLEGLDQGAVEKVPAPREVVAALLRHFLGAADVELHRGSEAAEAERVLCARAMAALYHHHAAAIGAFEGVAHVTALLDVTLSKPLRHCLLRLAEALLLPAAAREDERAARAATANASAFVAAGGVQLAVDLVAGAHEARERTQAPLQTQLIAYTSHAVEVKEWFYWPGGDGAERAGPLSKDEIKHFFHRDKVGMETRFWAAGMAEPQPLEALRELRWLVSTGAGTLGAFEAAEIALRVLHALVQGQAASDASGRPLLPLPRVRRQLASPACLPHLAQVLLTGEPALVSLGAALLEEVLAPNADALGGLAQTGALFFALAYCGSNLAEVARLLQTAHLAQRAGGASGAEGGILAQRSALGVLVPEALLHMLASYGAGAFAAALVGDSDTPELIWTHRMRAQRLVPEMHRHLGDFPRRLGEHCHAVYEYVACPPVGYPELADELWCHRYYLRNLCAERFADWPIVDHVPLLQALLDAWRAEAARKPMSMSEADACAVLELAPDVDTSGVSEEALKAAYRRLARRWHPDRNPAGRERFQAVQAAYERLQAGAAAGTGPQPWRLLLLLRAQCILYRRYPGVLAPFKYAGYPLLLAAVTLPPGGGTSAVHFLAPERAPQLQAAVELCWLTCVASELNGEELTRSGGVAALGRLLQRCLAVLPADAPPTAPAAGIAANCLRAFAGMAAFANARAELAARPALVGDIVRACGLERATAAVEAALQAITQMAALPALQELLLEAGVLAWVVPLLFGYDATLEARSAAPAPGASAVRELAAADGIAVDAPSGAASAGSGGGGGKGGEEAARGGADSGPAFLGLDNERNIVQVARNRLAALAARALARVAGMLAGPLASAPCAGAMRGLAALLTPALAGRLGDADPRALLGHLSSSLLTPQVVWNAAMREEVLAKLEAARVDPGAAPPAAAFRFKALEGELVVAGVFVRVFNEQPAAALADPAAFCRGLVTYVHAQAAPAAFAQAAADSAAAARSGNKAGAEAAARRRAHLVAALTALRGVVEAHARLAALFASRSALQPLLNCIEPACQRLHAAPAGAPVAASVAARSGDAGAAADSTAPASGGGGAGEGAAAREDVTQRAHEVDIAAQALAVLVRLTAHAGCVDALAEERALLLALWAVHRPPSPTARLLALRLLHAVAATPAAAWAAAAHAGALYLLAALLPPPAAATAAERESEATVRAAIASLLGRLAAQPLHGPRVALLLGRLLPPGLVAALLEGPGEAVLEALATASETPERLWNREMALTTAEEVAALAAAARLEQARGRREWALPEDFQLRFENEAAELFVGGVYVRMFLRDSRFPLRSPKTFLEGLLAAYTARAAADGDAGTALVLAVAATTLLVEHPALAEHGAALGYVDALLRLLATNLPPAAGAAAGGARPSDADELGGSALRLLHALAGAPAGAEALSRASPPALPTLLGALRWGLAGSLLALETLARALAPANRMRDTLIAAALGCGLVPLLLAKLDWRRSDGGRGAGAGAGAKGAVDAQDQAEAAERVLAVAVLRALAAEGEHASAVNELLDASDVWAAYRGQRHDLFLPAGAGAKGGVVSALAGSEVARFALPAPEPPPPALDAAGGPGAGAEAAPEKQAQGALQAPGTGGEGVSERDMASLSPVRSDGTLEKKEVDFNPLA
ncbi:hypothetical protein WJX81_005943 [Elliptochloris bilobata]|uniref:J domain-containing protein n=1 Tax=Elliptochloris bilobata TaxID=381761 RepID=A0AAW1QMP1_9CHLO